VERTKFHAITAATLFGITPEKRKSRRAAAKFFCFSGGARDAKRQNRKWETRLSIQRQAHAIDHRQNGRRWKGLAMPVRKRKERALNPETLANSRSEPKRRQTKPFSGRSLRQRFDQ